MSTSSAPPARKRVPARAPSLPEQLLTHIFAGVGSVAWMVATIFTGVCVIEMVVIEDYPSLPEQLLTHIFGQRVPARAPTLPEQLLTHISQAAAGLARAMGCAEDELAAVIAPGVAFGFGVAFFALITLLRGAGGPAYAEVEAISARKATAAAQADAAQLRLELSKVRAELSKARAANAQATHDEYRAAQAAQAERQFRMVFRQFRMVFRQFRRANGIGCDTAVPDGVPAVPDGERHKM
jgi:hypothetical protein